MKLCYVAALAGWALMSPPTVTVPGLNYGFPNTRAPLSEWNTVASFDSINDCERENRVVHDKWITTAASTPASEANCGAAAGRVRINASQQTVALAVDATLR